MNFQQAVLNIRYDWPIWDYRINVIYSRTEGWIEGTNRWFSENNEGKYVTSSIEPAGLIFSGQMEEKEWHIWISQLKKIATDLLGVKIGELELGEVGDDSWYDEDLSVLGEYANIYKSPHHGIIESFFTKAKPKLAELDEIEIEKLLFRGDWHQLHDRIATRFQERRHPSTAKFLYNQIVNSKIPEFDYKPISRRCTWALADIGTDEAKGYLESLARSEDPILQGFANKRINRWNEEQVRKGRMIPSNAKHADRIKLQKYLESEAQLPEYGNCITAYQDETSIIVYQAYKASIASFAVENQKFGGSDFSFNRMTWIKPNYLWMMYRSGWATKVNQEKILAIRITKEGWETLLAEAVISSYKKEYYSTQAEWKQALSESEVRLQWDPNHDPYGSKKLRKAIQIGIKGQMLRQFNDEMILSISDITAFVRKQSIYVGHQQLQYLEIPCETIYNPRRQDLNIGMTTYP